MGETFALAAAALAGSVLVGVVLWRCRAGIEFSDEGFYLNWISDPWQYRVSTTLFGFVYHPLYRLVGGDVALLRQVNVLITLGLASAVGVVLLRTLAQNHGRAVPAPRLATAGAAFVFATGTLAYLDPWLPTPSYDSLALQSLLLAVIGLLWAQTDASRKSLRGWVTVGIAGWLTFMAKPTSAIALAIVAAVYLMLSGKLRWRLLALAVVTAAALGLVAAWVIDGSVAGLVERLSTGMRHAALLQAGHTLAEMWRLDEYYLGPGEKIALTVMTGLVFLGCVAGSSTRPAVRLGAAVLTLLFAAAGWWILAGLGTPRWASTPFRGLVYWAVPYGMWLGALLLGCRHPRRLLSRQGLALVLGLVALPHAFAFGSNGDYWWLAPRAAVFWVLAGLPLLAASREEAISWRAVMPAAAAAMPVTAAMLSLSMAMPYRQPQPLWLDQDVVRIAVTGARLRVPRQVAEYLGNLDRLARSHGFQSGDPMLDLTGQSPGALYAIGAKAIGRAWMIGGYPGSDVLAAATLDQVPGDELRRAWILSAPSGPRALSTDVLRRYQLDLARDYREVGVLVLPAGENRTPSEQHLFMPVGRALPPPR